MALVMTPIYTQTVGAGGASVINFTNIPQHFTDLKIVASVRGTQTTFIDDNIFIAVNGVTSGYGTTYLGMSSSGRTANGSSIIAGRASGANATASTFGSNEIYIPNYSITGQKSVIIDGVAESNTANLVFSPILIAGLITNTSPITTIAMSAAGGNIVQHSTFSLYGIIRSGA